MFINIHCFSEKLSRSITAAIAHEIFAQADCIRGLIILHGQLPLVIGRIVFPSYAAEFDLANLILAFSIFIHIGLPLILWLTLVFFLLRSPGIVAACHQLRLNSPCSIPWRSMYKRNGLMANVTVTSATPEVWVPVDLGRQLCCMKTSVQAYFGIRSGSLHNPAKVL